MVGTRATSSAPTNSPATIETVKYTLSDLFAEEIEIVQQHRAQKANQQPGGSPVEKVVEKSTEGEVRAQHSRRTESVLDPTRAPLTTAPVLIDRKEEFQGKLFDRFLKTKPPTFSGDNNAMVASNWFENMEMILKRIGCPMENRVSLATYQLRDDAGRWRSALERKYKSHPEDLTWAVFKTEFEERYYPKHVRAEKKVELRKLKQFDMTIVEYETKFTELSHFAPELISTEEERMFLFLQGMKPELQYVMRSHTCSSLVEMIQRAAGVEQALNL